MLVYIDLLGRCDRILEIRNDLIAVLTNICFRKYCNLYLLIQMQNTRLYIITMSKDCICINQTATSQIEIFPMKLEMARF